MRTPPKKVAGSVIFLGEGVYFLYVENVSKFIQLYFTSSNLASSINIYEQSEHFKEVKTLKDTEIY